MDSIDRRDMSQVQVLLRIPVELRKEVDDTVWRLRFASRNAFVRDVLEIFVPDLDCIKLAQFIRRYFPDQVEDSATEIVRQALGD